MSKEQQRPIIVRRIKKNRAGHHGGAWKIAYADFVTAMMAFFLLMWLLGSTTKGELMGIAEYFQTPLKVALAGGSGSGDSASVLHGGGKDLTRREGQVKKADVPEDRKTINLNAAKSEMRRLEAVKLKDLKHKIESAIESNASLRQFSKQLLLDITTEGLRIQIVDEQNRPMFAVGQALLQPHTRELLHEIGKALNEVENKIGLTGHTDATPYLLGEKSYSNWELSADRANASRRELIAGGMDEHKVLRVVGLGSSMLLNAADPFDPVNRRISIVVMNKDAEEAAQNSGETVNVNGEAPVESLDLQPAARR